MKLFSIAGILIALALSGCTTMTPAPNLKTVPSVDLARYMGRWNVIAYTPNFLEDGKVGSADTYLARPDGKMDNIYSFRKKTLDAPEKEWKGTAWVVNTQTNAEWRVRLLWPFTSEYLILELDPSYQWAVVASNGGKLVWVLARATSLSDQTYAEILSTIDQRGLKSSRLTKVPQP